MNTVVSQSWIYVRCQKSCHDCVAQKTTAAPCRDARSSAAMELIKLACQWLEVKLRIKPLAWHYIAVPSHYLSCLWLRPMQQLLISWLRNLSGQDIRSYEILGKITAWNICQYQTSWMDNLVSSFKFATVTMINQPAWFEILLLRVGLVIWGHNNVN